MSAITKEFGSDCRVELKDGMLGYEIKKSLNLSNMFADDCADRVDRIRLAETFFRTESGGLYCLMNGGICYMVREYGAFLIDANETERTGEIVCVMMDKASLMHISLTIGGNFDCSSVQTSTITGISEIISTDRKCYFPDPLFSMTNGRTNRILDDFEAKMAAHPDWRYEAIQQFPIVDMLRDED